MKYYFNLQVASGVAILSVIYMRLFLKESLPELIKDDHLDPLLLTEKTEKPNFVHQLPSPKDVFRLLRSRYINIGIIIISQFFITKL